MAYIEKSTSAKGEVSWRVQVRRKGVSETRTFRTKGRAREWAAQVEAGITGEARATGKHTLLEALRRYAAEVSPTKRGARWEKIRLKALEGDPPTPLVRLPVAHVTPDHMGIWRDARLREVGPATVRREMNLLASVFEVCRVEWRWVTSNPMRDVRKPPEPPARRRGVSPAEFTAIAVRLAEGGGNREVLAGFELAIETGMRAGEMWGLERDQVDLVHRVAHLTMTKNGDARDVALSPRAVEILRSLLADGRERVFLTSNAVRDALFRRARNAAGIPDLHFHDSRSEAVSRLAKRLNVLELAEQIGHRDIKSLQSYYRQEASERAKLLADEPPRTRSPRAQASGASRRRSRGPAKGTRGA